MPPSSGWSSPVLSRNTVCLPAPWGPPSPTFSPALIWNDASTNRICPPYCLLTEENAITGGPIARRSVILDVVRRWGLALLVVLAACEGAGVEIIVYPPAEAGAPVPDEIRLYVGVGGPDSTRLA